MTQRRRKGGKRIRSIETYRFGLRLAGVHYSTTESGSGSKWSGDPDMNVCREGHSVPLTDP